MSLHIIDMKSIPMEDTEILFYQNLQRDFDERESLKNGDKFDNLDRRRFLELSAKISALSAAGIILPPLARKSEAGFFLSLLIAFAVGVAASIAANLITPTVVEAMSRNGYAGRRRYTGRTITTEKGPIIWNQREGGILKTTVVNSSDRARDGMFEVSLWDKYNKSTPEHTGLSVARGFAPHSKYEVTLKQNELPYTGIKKYSIKLGIEMKNTNHPIIVLE